MKRPDGSIKTLFIACIVIITGVLLTIQTVINVSQFQGSIETQVKGVLEQQGASISAKLDQRLLQIEQKGQGLARNTSFLTSYDTNVMYGIAKSYIQSDNLVLGSGFWFAPNAFAAGQEFFGPYLMRQPGGSIDLTMDYSNAEYNYFSFDWYKEGMASPGKVFWVGPYPPPLGATTLARDSPPSEGSGEVVPPPYWGGLGWGFISPPPSSH